MSRVIESMTKLYVRNYIPDRSVVGIAGSGWFHYTVRIWRQEDEVKDEYRHGPVYDVLIGSWASEIGRPWTAKDLAEFIATLKGVNAVEVLDEQGNGPIIYPEWP